MTTKDDETTGPAGFTADPRYTHHGLPIGTRDDEPGEWAYAATDDEAQTAARDNIAESWWAFRSEFLAAHIPALRNGAARRAFDAMREKLCEDANDLVRAMLGDDETHAADDAIRADGRGHFLAPYDGEEVDADGGGYFYRVN